MEIYEQDRTVNACLNVVFALGVVAVLVYMLFGSIYAVYASLGIYAFSFSVLCLFAIRKLFLVSSYKERLKRFESQANMTDAEKEAYLIKKDEALKLVNKTKHKEIIKAILAGTIAIFAVVVLVLF